MSYPIESDTFMHIHRIYTGTWIDCGVTGWGSRIENLHIDTLRKNTINFLHKSDGLICQTYTVLYCPKIPVAAVISDREAAGYNHEYKYSVNHKVV